MTWDKGETIHESRRCLIDLVLIVGQLGAHHGYSGHQTGQDGTDAGNFSVHVHDDSVSNGPHIIQGKGRRHHAGAQHDNCHRLDVAPGNPGTKAVPKVSFFKKILLSGVKKERLSRSFLREFVVDNQQES